MDAALWIVIIIFSVAFLLWIYKDGKFHHLLDTKIKNYRSPEIFIILYTMLIIISLAISIFHLIR
ncbi:MAG: hypothetical protein EG826_00405 [Deltaproteobacteria bacterium]|nr:hypothetical protein [Deltaproteobacteria bacterium]